MKKYELMYILRADLDDETRGTVAEGLHKILTDNGAIIDEVIDWGLRDFAYLINDELRGYYTIVKFSSDAPALNEFERLSKHNENVLRHLIVVDQ